MWKDIDEDQLLEEYGGKLKMPEKIWPPNPTYSDELKSRIMPLNEPDGEGPKAHTYEPDINPYVKLKTDLQSNDSLHIPTEGTGSFQIQIPESPMLKKMKKNSEVFSEENKGLNQFGSTTTAPGDTQFGDSSKKRDPFSNENSGGSEIFLGKPRGMSNFELEEIPEKELSLSMKESNILIHSDGQPLKSPQGPQTLLQDHINHEGKSENIPRKEPKAKKKCGCALI